MRSCREFILATMRPGRPLTERLSSLWISRSRRRLKPVGAASTRFQSGGWVAPVIMLNRAEASDPLAALFTSLGLDDAIHVPTREYSYGMKKKLLIAEALVHEPDLLILDEPALGLDPPSRAALLRMLEERSAKGVCTLAVDGRAILKKALLRVCECISYLRLKAEDEQAQGGGLLIERVGVAIER